MGEDDDSLRRLAVDRLGPFAPPLAREALEAGTVGVERNVLAWTGSTGTVHGHRVELALAPELCARVNAAPSVLDAITAALAGAVAAAPGEAMAELVVVARAPSSHRTSAYRGRL